MRLGKYACKLTKGTKAHAAYDSEMVDERHRHRYEVNNNLRYKLVENGMQLVGMNPERDPCRNNRTRKSSMVCWSTIPPRIKEYS